MVHFSFRWSVWEEGINNLLFVACHSIFNDLIILKKWIYGPLDPPQSVFSWVIIYCPTQQSNLFDKCKWSCVQARCAESVKPTNVALLITQVVSFLFCFSFCMYWWIVNQCVAYHHLLYWTVHICKCAWVQNKVNNLTAERWRGSHCVQAWHDIIVPDMQTASETNYELACSSLLFPSSWCQQCCSTNSHSSQTKNTYIVYLKTQMLRTLEALEAWKTLGHQL